MSDMTEEEQTRLIIATLFGALARAMDEVHPGTAQAFMRNLEGKHTIMRNNSSWPESLSQAVRWARDSAKPQD